MKEHNIAASTHTVLLRPNQGPECNVPCVRVFRHSPGFVELQIRAQGPVTRRTGAVSRKTYSHARLDAGELRDVIRALNEGLADLEG